MRMPNVNKMLRPALEFLAKHSGRDVHIRQKLVSAITEQFNLAAEEKSLSYKSSGETTLHYRAGWACTCLFKAGLIERPRRGYVRITQAGENYLSVHPGEIRTIDLENNCPAFKEWVKRSGGLKSSNGSQDKKVGHGGGTLPPEERIQNVYQEINNVLKEELLEEIMKQTPDFFERLVVKLLEAMGYGGKNTLAKATGQIGDGGIDGIIHQDVLGLDVVYLQAKRYNQDNYVGSGAMRDFIGALSTNNASKGVFITTSRFSESAKEATEKAPQNIITVDGEDLVKFMLEYEVGVRIDQTIKLYKIDGDFFDE